MKVSYDPKVKRFIDSINKRHNSDVIKVVDMLRDYGFNLTVDYLKKLIMNLWELRAGRYRLIFGLVEDEAIIVNIFYKKTRKTPIKEIRLALKRLKKYQ